VRLCSQVALDWSVLTAYMCEAKWEFITKISEHHFVYITSETSPYFWRQKIISVYLDTTDMTWSSSVRFHVKFERPFSGAFVFIILNWSVLWLGYDLDLPRFNFRQGKEIFPSSKTSRQNEGTPPGILSNG
jgi:hypothetical protein